MALDLLETVGLSDVGNVRQYNEDTIAIDTGLGLMALADGMGGHRAGEVASRMAVDVLMQALRAQFPELRSAVRQHQPLLVVDRSINQANRAIYEAAQAQPGYYGMGTTLALTFFYDNGVVLGHIGDSRIYRLREGRLELLTRDDSLVRDQIELGLISATDASESHNRSLVTRALGITADASPHLRRDAALPGDVYLLCSDGLNDLVDDADIELMLDRLQANLPLAAQHLIQTAKDNGGYDNVSVILVKVLQPFPATVQHGWWRRVLAWLTRRSA
ncbi:MAG TPA: protein phosphatase 2C domain-containing protein [Casimicrobiaceae bacterium]|nr:protein phosphatase 2C domain-containing protein [Casimicrobiaceae bacterium]